MSRKELRTKSGRHEKTNAGGLDLMDDDRMLSPLHRSGQRQRAAVFVANTVRCASCGQQLLPFSPALISLIFSTNKCAPNFISPAPK